LLECDLTKRWKGEAKAYHLEVIYLLKSIMLSHILSRNFKLQFSFVLTVVSTFIMMFMKNLLRNYDTWLHGLHGLK
jgi:hypothetical protein